MTDIVPIIFHPSNLWVLALREGVSHTIQAQNRGKHGPGNNVRRTAKELLMSTSRSAQGENVDGPRAWHAFPLSP